MNYDETIKRKIQLATHSGVEINENEINPMLFPHQRDIVLWATRGGRRAIFAKFGLGKTFMQLEICRILQEKTGERAIIILPLGVKQEFSRDAEKLGISTEYIRNDEEAKASNADILITNYERVRDDKLDPNQFGIVSLDEASVLRGYGTKTYQSFLTKFTDAKYRFVCTATPSPNRYKELIHYAGFLDIMDTGAALTKFFQRDSTKANNLSIYPSQEKAFWLWMASWACFLTKPSDLGYSDKGYDLPDFKVVWHEVESGHQGFRYDRQGQGQLVDDANKDLQGVSAEKRNSIGERIEKMMEIIKENPNGNMLLWHDQEGERRAIKKALPEAVEVYGSLDLEKREQRIIDFSDGKIKYLATKPVISGSGCNFQRHCHKAIFLGIGFKFNDFIQAVHRIYRFMQDKPVTIHIIHTDKERQIVDSLKTKWQNHDNLVEKMTTIIKKYGLSKESMKNEQVRTIGIDRHETKGELYTAVNNDCVKECQNMEENSVDLICTSIPFGNHYEYSNQYEDFGHNLGNDEFFEQMDHLTPNLLRILRPGRIYACHVKDRILFGNVTKNGCPTVDPFHALTIAHAMKHGFLFIGMITIETDVVRENNQTYRLGWTEQCKDGSKMGVGCPEYLLLFRKKPTDTSKAYADIPVEKNKADYSIGQWQIDASGKWTSSGNRFLTTEEINNMEMQEIRKWFSNFHKRNVYDYKKHVELYDTMEANGGRLPKTFEACKVPARMEYCWHDVNRMETLNGQQVRRNVQMHVCPLQFDIVDRIITRYSNPGELVFDPFGGLMTTPYRAIKLGRKGYATELNSSYYADGLTYLHIAEQEATAPTLFDLEDL